MAALAQNEAGWRVFQRFGAPIVIVVVMGRMLSWLPKSVADTIINVQADGRSAQESAEEKRERVKKNERRHALIRMVVSLPMAAVAVASVINTEATSVDQQLQTYLYWTIMSSWVAAGFVGSIPLETAFEELDRKFFENVFRDNALNEFFGTGFRMLMIFISIDRRYNDWLVEWLGMVHL